MRNTLDTTLGIMGHGHLHQTLQTYLEDVYRTVPIEVESSIDQVSSCALILYCNDIWSPGTLLHLNHRCVQSGVALLPIYTLFNMGIIGPCVLPRIAGCATCAEQRRLGAIWNDAEQELYRQYSNTVHDMTVSQPWLTSWNQEVLARLVIEEVATYLHTPEQVRTRQAQLYFALDTQKTSLHRFLPMSDCPDCGHKQPDTPEQATILLQSRSKPGPFSYHVRDLVASTDDLFRTYVDAHLGVICSLVPQSHSAQPHTFSFAKSFYHSQWVQLTSMGIATKWDQTRVVAIAEALERLAGQHSHKKHIARRASYHQLEVPTLDPTTLGLHSPEQYARPHFPFVPYHHDLVTDWAWGYSFQRREPLLVPATCVYYGGIMHRSERDAFLYEISNGCALGSNLEEAILHGILEIAERDAFLLTWYAQLALPRLEMTSVTDPAIRLLVKHIEQASGYTLLAFNATLDHAIPCLWVMAVNEQQETGKPKVLCGAGSHPHPERALLKALQELGGALLPSMDPEIFEQEKEHLHDMFNDPFKVQSMADHSHLYWLPEAFERLSFLYYSPRHQSFQEAFSDFYAQSPQSMDLRDDLITIINHYIQRGIDIVVVDQTSPEQDLHDLRCVKVLMPGTLSMTFGHAYRRTIGCQRLYQLPYTLGYRPLPLTEGDINPHPHPFP